MKKTNEYYKDLISVLVPMYNTENTIARCIKSILNQTYTNLEVVLLNDGSKDKTYEIAESFAKLDSRIKLFTKENEKNISITRNFLLNKFTGKYVVWVDSDDVLHKKYVETLYKSITKTNADCAVCGFSLKFHNSPLIKNPFSRTKLILKENIFEKVILNHKVGFSLWNKMYKAELLHGLQFNLNVKFGEDFDFILQYLKRCNSLVYINQKLYKYISRPTSETRQKFSDKKISFIEHLKVLLQTEEDAKIKNILSSWLFFSSITILYLAKKGKYENKQHINLLYNEINTNKQAFKNQKGVEFLYRFVALVGLHTWAKRKPPKSKK